MGKSHDIVLHYDQAPGLLRCPVDSLLLECHEDVWTVLVVELYYSGGAPLRTHNWEHALPLPECPVTAALSSRPAAVFPTPTWQRVCGLAGALLCLLTSRLGLTGWPVDTGCLCPADGRPVSTASAGPLLPGAQTCVGWGFFLLFDPLDRARRPSPGSLVALRTGHLECRLRSGPGRWLRDAPVLDWRAVVGPEDPGREHTHAPGIFLTLAEERPPEFRPDAEATIQARDIPGNYSGLFPSSSLRVLCVCWSSDESAGCMPLGV